MRAKSGRNGKARTPSEIERGAEGEKNLFPIVPTIFKSQTRGRREEANPSARGVNRDKRRIVLRIQSVTIQQAAYGVHGRGRGRDVTIRGNAHSVESKHI